MTRKFEGKIATDIRDSKEDWGAFTHASPPEGSPNVVFLLWDDTGIATWDFYGGLVEMPNMERIVDKGMTGRNPSTLGMNTSSEATMGFPGLSGHIPHEAAMISEVLQEKGWSTFTSGT
jgi:arylsulfatase A-like enzyme